MRKKKKLYKSVREICNRFTWKYDYTGCIVQFRNELEYGKTDTEEIFREAIQQAAIEGSKIYSNR